MNIIPAIDLIQGKCVRLFKGDFEQQTVYSDKPLDVALSMQNDGAKFLHVVNLDGAKNEASNNTHIIKEIVANTNLQVQTGGGIRTQNQVEELLLAGVDKVVIGSLAIKSPAVVKQWLEHFGNDKIVIAFDVKVTNNVPMIAVDGWQNSSVVSLWTALDDYLGANTPIKHILCTDIDRDGVLNSPNFALYKEIQRNYPKLQLQASGGVGSFADIQHLSDNNTPSVIIGKALYEKKFTLVEALNVN